ncbi:ROK family transcriptional regulator [Catenulispora yoronensis]|uniref:ROK family transcriptional regulator n=1 Tax=Catenulispora yoronensis TaxID=450799 RepID=A0ABN2URA1_9ACTN
MRTLNERAALTLLLERHTLTRAELEAHTGLSKASAAEVLRRLERGGLIRKAGTRPGSAGPAAQAYGLDGTAAAVAGVDLTARAVEVVVADLAGTIRAARSAPAPEAPGEQEEFLADTIETAALDAGVSRLDQVVIGVPGIVRADGRALTQAVQLTGWSGLGDLSGLHRRLPEVHLENDVNLVALRELDGRGGSFVLLWLGAGVGAGTVLAGELWRGATGRGGEIGSVVVPDPVSRGRSYGVDGGPLGELLGAGPLAALARAHGLDPDPGLAGIGALLADAPPAYLADVAARVTLGVTAAVGVLDPGRVVLGGPLCVAAGEPLRALVAARMRATALAEVEIELTAVEGNAVVEGALHDALHRTRERVFQAGTAGRAGTDE